MLLLLFPTACVISFLFSLQMCLFLYWLCASVVAGLIVRRYSAIPDKRSAEEKQTTQEKEGMSTIIRKYFHFVVVAVYVPGLLLDQEFLFLASVIAMVAFILLEVKHFKTTYNLDE